MRAQLNRCLRSVEVWTVVAALLSVIGFLVLSPALTPPDEGAHLAYPRTILLEHRLPTLVHTSDGWENHQPPLYYLMSLPIVLAGQALPFHQQVFVDRSVSVLFYVCTLLVLWALLKRVWPNDALARTMGLLALLLPMVVYSGASYSNDIAVVMMAVALLYFGISMKGKLTVRRSILFGLLLSAGLLTKVSLYPMLLVMMLWMLWRTSWRIRVVVALTVIASSGWWFVHNLTQVGDWLGIKYGTVYWQDQHRSIDSIKIIGLLVGKLGLSFIGVFGKANIYLPIPLYILIGLAVLAALFFFVRYRQHVPHATVLFWISGATLMAVLYENTIFFQPQGRYLLPLVPCIAIAVATSIHALRQQRVRRWLVTCSVLCMSGLAVISLLTIHRYYQRHPSTFFTYPTRLDLQAALVRDNASRVTAEGGAISFMRPAKFVLSTQLVETSHDPELVIVGAPATSFDVRVDWRIPGQVWFDQRRTQLVHVDGQVIVHFSEPYPTALESIRLQFLAPEGKTVLQNVYLRAR